METKTINTLINQITEDLFKAQVSLGNKNNKLLEHHINQAMKQLKEVDIHVYNLGRMSGVPYALSQEDWK